MSRVLDIDPISGIATTFRYDSELDKTIIGYHQNTTPIIEANKRAVIETDAKAQMKNDLVHYARIPTIVQYEWLYKHGVDFNKTEHQKAWMRLLNSPDYKYLKTTTIYHDR